MYGENPFLITDNTPFLLSCQALFLFVFVFTNKKLSSTFFITPSTIFHLPQMNQPHILYFLWMHISVKMLHFPEMSHLQFTTYCI